MKKSILGSLIAVCIVLSIDSLSRVFIALALDISIPMFSYIEFPGILWPSLLVAMAMISAFMGAVFAFTYGRGNKYMSLSFYLFFLVLMRYGQIHLLYGTETIIYPIIALLLSLIAIVFAWKIIFPKKSEVHDEENDRHHPVSDSM